MFDDLDEKETAGEISDDYVLQLRQIFNLQLPEIEIIEKINEEDFAEIENFKIEDDSVDDVLTYMLSEDQSEEPLDPENEQDEQNESMHLDDDGEEYFFHVEKSEEVQDDDQEADDGAKDQEADEISNHFE